MPLCISRLIHALVLAVALAAATARAAMPPEPAPFPDHTVTVSGQTMHYLEGGTGPTVVLVHGLGGDRSEWAETMRPLAAHYHIVVPDQLGFGLSDHPLISYSLSQSSDALLGFLSALKIDHAALVGESFGGAIAADLALRHPERVDVLVMIDAGYGYAIPHVTDPAQLGHVPGTMRLMNPASHDGVRALMALVFTDHSKFITDKNVETELQKFLGGNSYTLDQFFASYLRRDDVLDGRLGTLQRPVLLVHGREDGITPVALDERFYREIAGSQLLVFEQCGHYPPLEQPERFNAALLDFLGKSLNTTLGGSSVPTNVTGPAR